jgi:hypothetical protein
MELFPTHVCDDTHPLAEIGLYNYELEQYWFGLNDVLLLQIYNVEQQRLQLRSICTIKTNMYVL